MPQLPFDLRPMFPGERAALLALLANLSPAEWRMPTACAGWSVQDLISHLLADDLGLLARNRDSQGDPSFGRGLDLADFDGLVAAIDRQNDEWVRATRRLSPSLLRHLLAWSGNQFDLHLATLNPDALAGPVDWVGPAPAPVWLDIAREYTERWVHQQQIRDALGRPGLTDRHWLAPVLATFAHAFPRSLAPHPRDPSNLVRVAISGPAGGSWDIVRGSDGWHLGEGSTSPSASVTLDAAIAWRLFTKGITPSEARRSAQTEGDPQLVAAILNTVAVLATR